MWYLPVLSTLPILLQTEKLLPLHLFWLWVRLLLLNFHQLLEGRLQLELYSLFLYYPLGFLACPRIKWKTISLNAIRMRSIHFFKLILLIHTQIQFKQLISAIKNKKFKWCCYNIQLFLHFLQVISLKVKVEMNTPRYFNTKKKNVKKQYLLYFSS